MEYTIKWNEEIDGWEVRHSKYPGLVVEGRTPHTALRNFEIEMCREIRKKMLPNG